MIWLWAAAWLWVAITLARRLPRAIGECRKAIRENRVKHEAEMILMQAEIAIMKEQLGK